MLRKIMSTKKSLSNHQLDEAMPQNFKNRFVHSLKAALGRLAPNSSATSKGALYAGKAANWLMNTYYEKLGRSGQKPSVGTLVTFLKSQGYSDPTNIIQQSIKSVPSVPGLPIREENSLRYFIEIINENSSVNQYLSDDQVASAIMAVALDYINKQEFGEPEQISTPANSPNSAQQPQPQPPASNVAPQNTGFAPLSHAQSEPKTTGSSPNLSVYTSSKKPQVAALLRQKEKDGNQTEISNVGHMKRLLGIIRNSDPKSYDLAVGNLSENEEMVVEVTPKSVSKNF